MRTLIRTTLVALLLIAGLACNRGDTIVIGAKAFTEGYVLGHMAAMVLQDAGYDVQEQFGVATAAMRGALESGQIDLYYEYTGTAYTVYAKGSDPAVMADSARVLAAVRAYDSATNALAWLQPMPFNNTYTLLMQGKRSKESGIATLTELANAATQGGVFTIAVDAEFYERPDGLQALLKHYGFPEMNVVKMDAGLTYKALAEGEVDVAMGYSTDGRIPALKLVQLADDKAFFPAYNPAAVVRQQLLQRAPGVRPVLEKLNQHITTATMQRLNADVDLHHRDPRKVAREWLVAEGIIRD